MVILIFVCLLLVRKKNASLHLMKFILQPKSCFSAMAYIPMDGFVESNECSNVCLCVDIYRENFLQDFSNVKNVISTNFLRV